ncbi:MAG: polyprenyl synthetase family protein [Ruminococcus sp.]|nr:polyprenyl synthetase family protein [Ruminococcus sp.]
MKKQLDIYCGIINNRLDELMDVYCADNALRQLECVNAMKYSLSAGGKRIRPVLAMEFAKICGGDGKVLDSACALEMIHTFSLIHDDLPCMDNDDMRRGKPSCHKAFGETVALLAGDALENYAFEIISSDGSLSYEQRVRIINSLSKAVGVTGMIGGQVIDTVNTAGVSDGGQILEMYSMKTGALIKCACEIGCICGERYELIPAADEYAEALGLAFQIVDDILDVTADEKLLGKPVGSDERSDKKTYAAVFGLEAAKKKGAELTEAALSAAEKLGVSGFLANLTRYLLNRKS